MNSFKKLEKQNIKKVSHQHSDINSNLSGSIGFITLVSNVIELYLPKVAELLVNLSGGACKSNNTPPNKMTDSDMPDEPTGPVGQDDDFRNI